MVLATTLRKTRIDEADLVEVRGTLDIATTSRLRTMLLGGLSSGAGLATYERGLDTVENRESLRPALAKLPRREQRIVAMRYYGGRTRAQIANEIGISQMHVSRLLASSLDRLRRVMAEE